MYEFERETRLDYPIEQVFHFFSTAENLERITPPFVGFRILTPTPIVLKKGTLIDYKLRVHGIPIRWRTLIAEWQPPYRFVDQQLKGPYRQWIHEHTFKSIHDGKATLMQDHVKYSIFAGKLVHFMVKRDIESIFQYRTKVIQSLFPGKDSNRDES